MTVSTDSNKSRAGREIRLGWLVAAIVALVIIADQWLKIWVKTHFYLGEDLELTSWFHLKFIENNGFVAFALIIAGAAGNIFDCVLYGEIFNNPWPPEVAMLFPDGGGYASWFEGKVVDMLYFPLFSWTWPAWMPWIGGSEFEFFQYIFNIADASISVGVLLLIFFYSSDASKAFSELFGSKNGENREETGGRKENRK